MSESPDKKNTITMTAEEVSKILKTTPAIVRAAVLNGTMPIGLCGQREDSTHTRTIIVRSRFEKWMDGELRL